MIQCERCEAKATNIEDATRHMGWLRALDGGIICVLCRGATIKQPAAEGWSGHVVDESSSTMVPMRDKITDCITLVRVTRSKLTLVLTHDNGAVIRISRYKHGGTWRWSDSRIGPVDKKHVDTLLARLGLAGRSIELIKDYRSLSMMKYGC